MTNVLSTVTVGLIWQLPSRKQVNMFVFSTVANGSHGDAEHEKNNLNNNIPDKEHDDEVEV